MASTYVNWGESRVKLTWKKDMMPPIELITSVHGYCFYKEKVMLIDLKSRGWDLPGGHRKNGETPEQNFTREVLEEGYVEGEIKHLGALEVNHLENPQWNEASIYPRVGFQLFYRMDIKNIHPFAGRFESTKRAFVEPKDIPTYKEWDEISQLILQDAIQMGMEEES